MFCLAYHTDFFEALKDGKRRENMCQDSKSHWIQSHGNFVTGSAATEERNWVSVDDQRSCRVETVCCEVLFGYLSPFSEPAGFGVFGPHLGCFRWPIG